MEDYLDVIDNLYRESLQRAIRPSFTYSNINMDKRAPGLTRSMNSPSVLIPSLIQSACNCQREYATMEALDFN